MKIAISGLNNTDNPAPGIGVAKSLSKFEKIGLSYDVNEPGIYQGVFEKVYLMPYPSIGWDDYKNRLKEIKERSDVDIFIPTLDAELPLLIKNRESLEKLDIRTLLPSFEEFEKRDKKNLPQFCEKFGVQHPKTLPLFSLDDLVKSAEILGFPLMVKGNYYKAYMANNLEEAIDYFYKIANEWGYPLLAQEVVRGEEINFVGLSNYELMGGVAMKKLTTTSLGKVWSAVSIKNEPLLRLAEKFSKTFKGAFELEAIVSNNQIYLIEINPRFPAWVHFATMLGVNLPKMMIDLVMGEKVEKALDYPTEKMYVRYVEECITDFKNLTTIISKKEL